MRIGLIGGTGKEGRGLALRWAKAGHIIAIGSRDEERARSRAKELTAEARGLGAENAEIEGGDNAWTARNADVVLLSVPYAGHADLVRNLKENLAGRIVIDITVPLRPPKVRVVHLPEGHAAALETQEILGSHATVVAALHHVSAVHLADLSHEIDCDVLVCTDDEPARKITIGLIQDLGLRGLDAGALRNAIALEALTSVLLHMNKRYGSVGTGIRITGLT
jgi:NADPH-dependent F420 reductase